PYQARDSKPSSPGSVGGIPGEQFVAEGYAVALFSVRGTGDSGGCFGFKSAIEQEDQGVVVESLAARPWSNGKVGMIGLSYPGTTPVMAAIQNPPSLKTIVIAGTILDEYNFIHTPQGAVFFEGAGVGPVYSNQYGLLGGPSTSVPSQQSIATTPERVCPELVDVNTVVLQGEATGQRDPEYWKERRFIDRVPDIQAATFVVHGFQDRWGSGHAFQDDWAWQSLQSAPKRMLVGQWWHEWPNRNSIYPDYSLKDWKPRLTAWFDYWLKGWGDRAPGLGQVDFQDTSGEWHQTDAWPPPVAKKGQGHSDSHGPDAGLARRRDEVLYLSNGGIRPKASDESSPFVSVPPPWRGGTDPNFAMNGRNWRMTTPCPDPTRLVYMSEPVKEPTVIAGNAFAWLNIQSSAPGGLFELQLYDVGPDFSCDGPPQPGGDLRPLTEGAIDLQYHHSEDYRAKLFPVLAPEHVRVDLASLSERLAPGHRLA
ncbi:MAG: CocE/NonD family hydrolase, partial [Actinobacteria bacterium]|nr:CocE/NonD family hydrolase [Actinomycetota bacterium]